MNHDTLLEELKRNSMTFTVREIQEMMDQELNKNPEEMDTELIDLCANALNNIYFGTNGEKYTEAKNNKKENRTTSKKIKFSKILIIAAAFIIVTSIAIPVSARYIHNEASNKIVQFFNNHFKIDLRNGNQSAKNHSDENIDLIKKLNQVGFENVVLPADLLKNNYSKDDITISEDESYLTSEINFEIDNNVNGYISITKHKTNLTEFSIGQENIGTKYNSVKQITVNGMDVIIFNYSESSYIEYVDNNIEYSVHLNNCSFDSAIKIAESLK